jgi:hypothetical protein
MREFNQASLDARLADIAGNLTPEQAIRVKERVRERIAGSNLDFTPEAIDGAFNLIGAIASRTISLPNLGAAGERLSSMLGTLDLRHISLPVGDMAGQAGAALTRMAGGLGRVWGAVPDIGAALTGHAGDVSGAIGDLAGSAQGAADALGNVVDIAGSAGDLAGIVLGALGDVLGSIDV